MNGGMQAKPLLAPRETPAPAAAPPRPYRPWLSWWVLACLAVLALNAHRQFAIQQEILMSSRDLERLAAESTLVSEETYAQLNSLRHLAAVTAGVGGKLAKAGTVNKEIGALLESLESTVEAIRHSISRLEGETGKSHALLQEILAESAALQEELLASQKTGGQVTEYLTRLVELQEAINADLAEMNRKTEFLDRFTGGE